MRTRHCFSLLSVIHYPLSIPRVRVLLEATFVALLTALIYTHAPHGAFQLLDDGALVYKNPLVTSMTPETLGGIFSTYDPELYIPATLLSYQIEYALVGENPALFHITNVLLHILNALLIFFLIRELTKSQLIPFLTALLFAVHPLHTEAVMWIAARKDLLSAAFFLGSLLLYCKMRKKESRKTYVASIALFLGALLSKVVTATLPLVLLIVDDIMQAKKRVPKLPYYVLAAVFLFVGMIGKTLSIYALTYSATFLLAGKSAVFYLQKMLIPLDFSVLYQQLTPITITSEEFFLPLIALALLFFIARKSRGISKLLSFGILWYGVTLLPNLGNFSRVSKESIFFASDRYAYLPSIGIFLIVAYGASIILKHHSRMIRTGAAATTAVVIVTLSCLSYRQSILWLTPKTLFMHAVEVEPRTHLAYTFLGMEALGDDRFDEAVEHLQTATDLAPKFDIARAHLGLALIKNGDADRGVQELHTVIEMNPQSKFGYEYLAYGQMLEGKTGDAEKTLMHLLSIDPGNAQAFQMLGTLAEQRGDSAKAKAYYERSIALNDRSIRAKAALARLLRQSKN